MISMALCEQSQIINLAEEARANLHADGGKGRLSVDYKTNKKNLRLHDYLWIIKQIIIVKIIQIQCTVKTLF